MTIKGTVKGIRYENEDSGFRIIEIQSGLESITAAGAFPRLMPGEDVTLEGEFIEHPRFGTQFKTTGITREQPATLEAMIRYLSSGLIKGIGPKTAENIAAMFGVKALETIEKNPLALKKVKGVSGSRAQQIHDEYMKNKSAQDIIMFLQDKGISVGMALKIRKVYGGDTMTVVTQNPYRLIEDIDGIGFITADALAAKVGIEKDSPLRLMAGIIYALREGADRGGNTFLHKPELLTESMRVLNLDNEAALENALTALMLDQKLKTVQIDGAEAVYLKPVYHAESGAAVRLVGLMKNAPKVAADPQDEICAYEQVNGISFNDEQKAAITCALTGGVSAITGGPGTGKTTIIRCLLDVLDGRRMTYSLMAPTGRAAKRMNESTGREASTIHRAVMFGRGGDDNLKQIESDVVIVDEVSMMDVFLFNMLLRCLRDGTTLVMLGDSDQLPSVGAGNVLADVLQRLPSVRLTKIYRQAEESAIITNAHLINRGEMPVLTKKDGDFFFITEPSPEKMPSLVVELVTKRLPAYLNIEPERIQVLCPMKNGPAGTINLNRLLADAFYQARGGEADLTGETPQDGIKSNGEILREGDKVMQTANNYEQEWQRGTERGEGVFNGDIGRITGVRRELKEADVYFEDGRQAMYSDNLDELVLAYAVTVHKSQGCEFDAVVIPIVPGSPMILTRNLLYTAITRAKKLVVLIGRDYWVKRMVDNNYVQKRNSGLRFFIDQAGDDYDRLFGQG